MSTIAIIGTVVGVAGTAYSLYSQNQATQAANSARPRPFVPVNIPQTAAMALAADRAGYALSDEDWKTRFPKLVLGRDYNIGDVGANLRGQTSPTITREMDKAGLSANLGNTEFKQAQNLGLPLLSLEQRDRNYFQKELSMNPQRTAGLSGQDIARISVNNTGNSSNYNQGLFGSRINAYNSQIQQGIANQSAAIGGLGVLGSLYSNYQQNQQSPQSSSIDPNYYSWSNAGRGLLSDRPAGYG